MEDRYKAALPKTVDGIIFIGGATQPNTASVRDGIALGDAGERPIAFVRLARHYPTARLVFAGGYGALPRAAANEADVMRLILTDLGVDLERVTFEDQSRNTYENARFSKELLKPGAGETWLLVTSAFHMPRAAAVFHAIGWEVQPFPVDFRTTGKWQRHWDSSISMARQVNHVDTAVREYLGLVVYYLLGRTNRLFP